MSEGSVIVTYKIMPDGVETDLDLIEKELKKKINPQKIDRVPIAFGLNAINVVKVIAEKEGEADRVAKEMEKIKGVQSVEIIEMSRGL
jgi:elongation factor 1-beta